MKEFKVLVDIGADSFPAGNPAHNRIAEDTEVYLFEARESSYQQLVSKFEHNPNYHVSNLALYDKAGTLDFYITRKGNCSSLLEPNPTDIHVVNRPDLLAFEKVEVVCSTLEKELGHLNQIDYLKIDTQGSEYEILVGAGDLLHKVVEIQCEVEQTEMYKTQKLDKDIKELLTSKGFNLTRTKKSANHADVWYYNTRFL